MGLSSMLPSGHTSQVLQECSLCGGLLVPFCLAEPTTWANLWVGQYLAWLAVMLSVS